MCVCVCVCVCARARACMCFKVCRVLQNYTIQPEECFFSSLDEYASKMIMLYRLRGGAYGDEMKTLLDQLDQVII